jgi:hypothetical protein
VRGTVWAPGNAPGQVPAGQEIPVYDAVVRVTFDRVEAIPAGAYCEQCVTVGGFSGRSAHKGEFVVNNITPGNYWLTVEKGQFRIETQITLEANQDLTLPTDLTTLPSLHDPGAGRWLPRVALAAGDFDDIQDVFGKMDIGVEGADGAFSPNAASQSAIHFYANGGDVSSTMGTLGDLVRDLPRMLQYHILFIPCAGETNTSALSDQNVLRNLRAYVAAGGKLYVTDWSGEWMDNVFPAHVTLGDGGGGLFGGEIDTPPEAYDPATNTWDTSLFGSADGDAYDSNNAEAVDPDLFAWLNGQSGPTVVGPVETYDAGNFHVEGNWNFVESLNRILVGMDEEGLPVYDDPKGWVIGGEEDGLPKRPLTVTFEPAGCGRVLYSTYHTTDVTHPGLVPQERILLYLIMEIGVCKEGPILI